MHNTLQLKRCNLHVPFTFTFWAWVWDSAEQWPDTVVKTEPLSQSYWGSCGETSGAKKRGLPPSFPPSVLLRLCCNLVLETVTVHGFHDRLSDLPGHDPCVWKTGGGRQTAAASGVNAKAAHLQPPPCWVKSTPAWVCMFSCWHAELFHFMPSQDLCRGRTKPLRDLIYVPHPKQHFVFLCMIREGGKIILSLKLCKCLPIFWLPEFAQLKWRIWDAKWARISVLCVLHSWFK